MLTVLVTQVIPAKTDEPVEMPFGMFTRVGPRTMYYVGCSSPSQRGTFWWCPARLKALSVVGFWGLGKRFSPEKTFEPIEMLFGWHTHVRPRNDELNGFIWA